MRKVKVLENLVSRRTFRSLAFDDETHESRDWSYGSPASDSIECVMESHHIHSFHTVTFFGFAPVRNGNDGS